MRVLILAAMVFGSHAANAEIFKCIGKAGKTDYQEKPCEAAAKAQVMDIKADPVKEAEAKARLEALQMEHDARREERLQEEEDAATQRYQTEQVNALNRSALAQQQQAAAQRRQAEALEMQNQQLSNPWWLFPRHVPIHRVPGMRDDHGADHDLKRPGRQDGRPSRMSPSPASPPPSRQDRRSRSDNP